MPPIENAPRYVSFLQGSASGGEWFPRLSPQYPLKTAKHLDLKFAGACMNLEPRKFQEK